MKTLLSQEQTFSPIKYQQEQKLLKSLRLHNDRNALKVLNREEIIAYRLPLHEAILRKLNKNGFEHSAEYLKQLIDFQDAYRDAAGKESIIWQRPRLIYQQNLLEHLAEELQQAENAHNSYHSDVEIDIFLKLAVEYCFGHENWWWLGHQLLFVIMNTCEQYVEDRGRRRALFRYIFGRFLFHNANEPEMALEHLKISRKISAEMSWNINVLFPENATIFSQACILIHKIRIIQAKKILQKDPRNCLRLCDKARKRALEGCYYEGVIESYMLKGNCEMLIFNSENSIGSFKKCLDILEKHENVDLRCETLKHLAIAYLRHGSLSCSLKTLHKLNEYAQLHHKVNYIAQAHKYLGEFYLKEGTARNATPLLMAAVKIFSQTGDKVETAKTRNLAAISVGIELMPLFSEIIKNSDPKFSKNHKEALKKLIRWKDCREPFWDENQTTDFSKVSTHTMGNFTNLSMRETTVDMSDIDDIYSEQILGITGLDTTTNITNMLSLSGVEKSGNTMSPPVTILEESDTDLLGSKDKGTLSEYVTDTKEDASIAYSKVD